jgi:hypothetical protein
MSVKRRFLIIPIFYLGILHAANAQKVAFWDGVEFDNNSMIVCFPSASNPQQYAFVVNTKEDFEKLKQDWIFEKTSFGKKPDNSLTLYKVKDKKGEWIGTIYPGINKLTNISASFVFDTLKLVELARRHPLRYLRKQERFSSREEYTAHYNKEMLEKGYLFSFGPGTWDGSFKIAIPSSDIVHTPVAAINVLTSKLAAITAQDNFSLRYELSEDNRDYKTAFKITVDCLKSVYEGYNDSTYLKSDWKPDPMFMTSFWAK